MKTTKWKIDLNHSEVEFKVKHLMISTITGNFRNYNLEMEVEGENFMKVSNLKFICYIESLDTNNTERDNHLKSKDFFDIDHYREIVFEPSESEVSLIENILKGNLTIKGTTKPIVLDVEYGGIIVDQYNQTKVGFTVSGKINRSDFGLVWNGLTETGGLIVGDEVKITVNVEMIKKEY